jgi:hypothetical protein
MRFRITNGEARLLGSALADALRSRQPQLLLYVRVQGLDAYEARFGTPLAQALRRLMVHRLSTATSAAGCAFDLDPSEFAVLLVAGACELERWGESVHTALALRGQGFALAASWGGAILPDEARRPSAAIALAERGSRPDVMEESPPSRPRPDVRALAFGFPRTAEDIARALADRLGVDERREALALAAALHDAGKAAIPDEVLDKTSGLNAAERSLASLYTLAGQRLLENERDLDHAAPILGALVAPWGDTPLETRILAVSVAFESMTSPRPHRPPLSAWDSISALRGESGTRFDPHVVDALIAELAARKVAKLQLPGPRAGLAQVS